ncbi:hypothetical protein J6590_108626 [Homalodisca vitripennis]|nr:hypothetical protein J6590_108626 [Homalodisca vitripennis]
MSKIKLERFNIENYILISEYSRTTTSGGGVAILSKEGLRGRQLVFPTVVELCQDKLFECCLAKFKIEKYSFILAGVYRTPQFNNSEFLDRLDSLIEFLVAKDKYLIITGDFNINMLNESKETKELKNILNRHGMSFLIDFPTRVTPTCKSCIDNFLTNINRNEVKVSGIITALSDHDAQMLELLQTQIKTGKTLTFVGRQFSLNNMVLFKSLLEKEDWLPVFYSTVNEKYDCFDSIFRYYFNLCFPLTQIKKENKKHTWITQDLNDEKNEIICLSKLSRLTKSDSLKNEVKNKVKQYNSKLTKCKKNYFDTKIKNTENISKTTWQIINKETKKNKSKCEGNLVLKTKESSISDPSLIAISFNDYFINVTDALLKDLSSVQPKYDKCDNHKPGNTLLKFQCPPLTETELIQIFDSLKNKSSSGYDGVPVKLIKFVKHSLSKPLLHLINSSLITGIFPDKLKVSKVIPVFKKGSATDIQNYRPISILPSISKIFERTMYHRLVKHLEVNDLYDKAQHGF